LPVVVSLLCAEGLAGCSSDGGQQPQYNTGGAAATGGGNVVGTGGTAGPSSGGTSTVGQSGTANGGSGAVASLTGGSPGTGGIPSGSGGASNAGGASNTGGSAGAAGAGGASQGGATSTGGGGGAGGMESLEKPPCLKDSSQIVLIGDSYVNWISHTFPADINAASMLTIEDFAVGGTSMGSGGIGLIPPQFDTALKTHPKILTVIMDGGGNDVLVADVGMFPQGGDCKMKGAMSPSIPDCQKIVQKALDAGTTLFLHMADSGVKDVMFFFYPHVPLNTVVGGTDPNGMLDYALPKIKAACDGAYETSVKMNPQKTIRCHFLDLVPVFDGHMDYFAASDIHPNPTGSKAMATAMWAKMKQDCVGQPASSGCCTPQ
jgi:hypothetical protein